MRFIGTMAFILGGLLVPSTYVRGDTVHVTHYVTKVQEERRSTRWTLTEWLRIKERMRMMDVWLAMFSQPKKDSFQPELNLEYGKTQGVLALREGDGDAGESDTAGSEMRGTLWLTNLITASTGLRTLNIDLGIEGFAKDSGAYTLLGGTQAQAGATGDAILDSGSNRFLNYTGNLRIFGKSTQDTSLVLKYGHFDLHSSLLGPTSTVTPKLASGIAKGASLSIYLTNFLGVEGNGMQYTGAKLPDGISDLNGIYYDYSAFVEISLLRLMVGRYREDWTFKTYDTERAAQEQGLLAGVKVQL